MEYKYNKKINQVQLMNETSFIFGMRTKGEDSYLIFEIELSKEDKLKLDTAVENHVIVFAQQIPSTAESKLNAIQEILNG